jgi:hypothetical protein
MEKVKERLVRFFRENGLFVLIIGGIVVAFMVLRTPASDVASTAEVDSQLDGGQPTLVEFYSNT